MTVDTPTGHVYWITGLSGSGKTTIATLLGEKLRADGNHVILLDGDHLREVFGDVFGHDLESRFNASMHYARLCHMLSSQGSHVVCATISMFDATRAWNRTNISNYTEAYIRVPMNELEKRDSKGIYSRAKAGELKNVVGVDIPWDEPKNPHVIIDNYKEMSPATAVEQILHSTQ